MRPHRGTERTATTSRRAKARVGGAALAGAAALATLTGCSGFEYREDICNTAEYPALSVGGTGSACFPDGAEPAAGYARYPEGKVPQQVGDKWDLYWDTRTLDENGDIIAAPDQN
ncbi:hypothetical protein GCM10022221_64440 [Actinocorallia aurea]